MSLRSHIKSMLVVGAAQAANILLSIIRMKVLAILVGPSGIGLFSIYNNLEGMVGQAAGLGMGSSGVREIASARGEEATLSRVRRVLIAAHLVQGAIAMVAMWLLRKPISTWLFGDETHATEVGVIGIAVLLGLVATSQTALLQGLRRIADLSRVTVIGAMFGTIAGLIAVWHWGEAGLIWFLLVQPLTAAIVALHYTRGLPKPATQRLSFPDVWQTWKPMAHLGLAFMLGSLATTATLLLVRGKITQDLGLEAAGQFAAAWGITMTYLAFLLNAMGADYYPRLTEVIRDRPAAIRMMNEQAQLGLAIGGPVLLLLIGLAPWVIRLLYSDKFGPAVELLQWQSVGNVFKLASWALGFSIVAVARSKTFLFLQINFNVFFLVIVWPSLSSFGIVAAGPAFTIAYILHFIVLNVVVRRILDFRWQAMSLGLLALHVVLSASLLAAALMEPLLAALAAPVLAALTALFGLRLVMIKIGRRGRLAGRVAGLYDLIGWPIPDNL